jgi:hypothetical protein
LRFFLLDVWQLVVDARSATYSRRVGVATPIQNHRPSLPAGESMFRSDRISAVVAGSPEGAAKQSRIDAAALDCFAAVAMTVRRDRAAL